MRTGDRILVTVKTYPELSKTYGETVCTAGLREDGTWVRLYPVPFRRLDEGEQYRLYDWITCPLTKHSGDERPESYRPTGEIERIDHVGTSDNWRERRELLLGRPRIHRSLDEIIHAAKNNVMSLAVFKPAQVIDFGWEATDRKWDPAKLDAVRGITAQPDLFDDQSWCRTFQIVDKVPYNFHYRIEDADGRKSRMRILEWQLGALYRNCLSLTEGDEHRALAKVKQNTSTNSSRLTCICSSAQHSLGTGELPTRGRSSGSFRFRMRSSETCSRTQCWTSPTERDEKPVRAGSPHGASSTRPWWCAAPSSDGTPVLETATALLRRSLRGPS